MTAMLNSKLKLRDRGRMIVELLLMGIQRVGPKLGFAMLSVPSAPATWPPL